MLVLSALDEEGLDRPGLAPREAVVDASRGTTDTGRPRDGSSLVVGGGLLGRKNDRGRSREVRRDGGGGLGGRREDGAGRGDGWLQLLGRPMEDGLSILLLLR